MKADGLSRFYGDEERRYGAGDLIGCRFGVHLPAFGNGLVQDEHGRFLRGIVEGECVFPDGDVDTLPHGVDEVRLGTRGDVLGIDGADTAVSEGVLGGFRIGRVVDSAVSIDMELFRDGRLLSLHGACDEAAGHNECCKNNFAAHDRNIRSLCGSAQGLEGTFQPVETESFAQSRRGNWMCNKTMHFRSNASHEEERC